MTMKTQKVGKMITVRKIEKMADLYKPFNLVREAEVSVHKRNELIEIVQERWEERFGERAKFVVENVMKILSAVQARMNANENPLGLAKNDAQAQSLVDVLAGAKAIQSAGAGASMALKSYVQQVQADKQGMTPDQAEIEAVKYAGKGSSAAKEMQDALQRYDQAVQQGNAQEAETIKQQFSKMYGFYQQLMNRMNTSAPQQPAQQPQAALPQPVALPRTQPAPTRPATGTPGGQRPAGV